MSREILFRGWCPRNEKWIEGDVVFQSQSTVIRRRSDAMSFQVDPSTVCQYTGLADRNGVKIFEGDILKDKIDIGVVKYGVYHAVTGCESWHVGFYVKWNGFKGVWRNDLGYWSQGCEICGNAFDNPELLEGGTGEDG